jgi:D-sedoheptulose 7-phosphate isomerase
MSHIRAFMEHVTDIATRINYEMVEQLATSLALIRAQKGRVFFLGVGGSAANCSHAVNDFRKLCDLESYCATDNVAELTAQANDEGWDSVFATYLHRCNITKYDAVMIFSVGGGDIELGVSANLISAIRFAKSRGVKVFGIVGREQGATAREADLAIVVPAVAPHLVTPLSESFQAVIWHALVSHPILQRGRTKW